MDKTRIRRLYEILWPNRCPGCNALIGPERLICDPCGERMLLPHDAVCHRCGKAACICRRAQFAYDRAIAVCAYRDEATAAVIRMKRSQNTNLAPFAARIIAERLRLSRDIPMPDCIMPVPMHPSKERRRGYNQAALIARAAAEQLCLPCREDVLQKQKTARAQHELNVGERARNVSSFTADPTRRLDGLRILLCDDVLTTGNTMSRCAALLKENGAAVVIAAVAATTVPPDWRITAPQHKEELS